MAGEKSPKESTGERGSRFLRNINIVGGVALFGLGIVAPAGAAVLDGWAALNAVQAGGFEAARRHFKKKRTGKS